MKIIVKRTLLVLGFILTSPLIILSQIGFLFQNEEFYYTFATSLSLLPGKLGSYIRLGFYKGTLQFISPDVYIGIGSFISRPSAVIRRNVTIGAFSIVGNAELKENTLISSRVSILSGKYQHQSIGDESDAAKELVFEKVTIGKNVWIGEGAIVMADVGDDSVVSAGSVVTRKFGADVVLIGNPARPSIKKK